MNRENKKELQFENYIQELEEKIQDPNYDEGVNFSLPENPSLEQSIKYSICKKILNIQMNSEITDEEIARKIGLNLKRTHEILFSHIHKFTLDELAYYGNKILPSNLELAYNKPN